MMGHVYKSRYYHMKTKLSENDSGAYNAGKTTFPQPFDDLFVRHAVGVYVPVYFLATPSQRVISIELHAVDMGCPDETTQDSTSPMASRDRSIGQKSCGCEIE